MGLTLSGGVHRAQVMNRKSLWGGLIGRRSCGEQIQGDMSKIGAGANPLRSLRKETLKGAGRKNTLYRDSMYIVYRRYDGFPQKSRHGLEE